MLFRNASLSSDGAGPFQDGLGLMGPPLVYVVIPNVHTIPIFSGSPDCHAVIDGMAPEAHHNGFRGCPCSPHRMHLGGLPHGFRDGHGPKRMARKGIFLTATKLPTGPGLLAYDRQSFQQRT
jgi:hypothetical protein